MNYQQLECTSELLPLYRTIAARKLAQSGTDFAIPDLEEEERGVLFLCTEGEEPIGALSLVTYDEESYYLSIWTETQEYGEIADELFLQMEDYLWELEEQGYEETLQELNNEPAKIVHLQDYLEESEEDEEEDYGPELLYYVNSTDAAGKAFLELHDFENTEQEYDLEYDLNQESSADEKVEAPAAEPFLLVPEKTRNRLVRLYGVIFDVSHKAAGAYIDNAQSDDSIRFYRIQEGRVTVGMFGTIQSEQACYVFSFGICRSYRRQGLALRALAEIRKQMQGQCGKLAVQVHGDNPAALALYRKFGFQTVQCMELYRREL